MRVPLLLHARPSNANPTTVYLLPGKWEIESDHVDSDLALSSGSGQDEMKYTLIKGLQIEGSKVYQLEFLKRGSESRISIYAVSRSEA